MRTFFHKIKMFFYYLLTYSWPVILCLAYVGLYFFNKYECVEYINKHLSSVAENFPLFHHWSNWFMKFFEWFENNLAQTFFGAVFLGLPALVITLLLIIFEALLWIVCAIITLLYMLLLFILYLLFVLIAQLILPIALLVGCFVLLISKRLNAYEDYVLQTVICTFSCILSVLLCVGFFIALSAL